MFLLNFLFIITTTATSIYNYNLPALNGGTINLSSYTGKKILIVNIATQCPTASEQLQELKQLQTQYAATLQIIAIPSNDFNNMEPGTDSSINAALQSYNLNFPVAAKQHVSGNEAHPLFQWLQHKTQNGVMDTRVRWSFTKFLVNAQGQLVTTFDPNTYAMDELVIDEIVK